MIERFQNTTWVPGTLALFLVVPWLVRDTRLSPVAWVGLAAGTTVTLAFTASRIALMDHLVPFFTGVAVVLGLLAAAEVTWRRVRGPEAERIGLGWLAAGTAAMALAFLPLVLPAQAVTLPIWFTPSLHLAAQVLFPAAIFVAVLRQRMWGLDLAVSRAVVAGGLTLGLVVVYAVVATALAGLLPDERRAGGGGRRRRRRRPADPAVAAAAGAPARVRRGCRAVVGGPPPRPAARPRRQRRGAARGTRRERGRGAAAGVRAAGRGRRPRGVVRDADQPADSSSR